MVEEHARAIAERRERMMAIAAEKGEEFDEDAEEEFEMTDEMLDKEFQLTIKQFKTDDDVEQYIKRTLADELALKDKMQTD
jgi:proline dehydrogenase